MSRLLRNVDARLARRAGTQGIYWVPAAGGARPLWRFRPQSAPSSGIQPSLQVRCFWNKVRSRSSKPEAPRPFMDEGAADPFAWMEDTEDPRAQAYMRAEHTYAHRYLSDTRRLQKELREEMLSRLPDDEETTPERVDGFLYSARRKPGSNYPIYCRKRDEDEAEEELVLDLNEEYKRYGYVALGAMKVSPCHRFIAYTLDVTGTGKFNLFVRSLETRQLLYHHRSPHAPAAVSSMEWAANGPVNAIYFTVPNDKLRPFAVYRLLYETGEPAVQVFEESDEQFFVDVSLTKDKEFLLINVNSKSSSEVWTLPAADVEARPSLFRKREDGVQYFLDHALKQFFILSNLDSQGSSYTLFKAADQSHSEWRPVVKSEGDVKVEDMDVLSSLVVLYEKERGLPRIRALKHGEECPRTIFRAEAPCLVSPGLNSDFTQKNIRFKVSSPVVREKILEYSSDTESLRVLRSATIQGTPPFKSDEYTVRQVFVPSAGGEQVPMTLVHSKHLELTGDNPTLLMGYGAYGLNLEPDFEVTHLPLLQRGWVLAYAHVRGGGELGLRWYRDGRGRKKWNSFHDFLSCAEYLISEKITSPARLAAKGLSAGGLLVGVMANIRPDLFRAIVLHVPFLDPLAAMTRPELPLTVHEYDEWGNPEHPGVHEYIHSYSPYHNIKKQKYPAMMAFVSLEDEMVPSWQSLKWLARLRSEKMGEEPLLLHVNADGNHFGADNLEDQCTLAAMEHAFLFKALGLRKHIY